MLRIAVCDDDKQMLDSLSAKISDCFSRRNESVLAEKFSSGTEFLTAHKAEPFDVIFLDIRMPERDGFDVAREICALSAKTYIIFVTTETALVYDSFDFRPFRFIPKTPPELFDRQLERAVDKLLIQISAYGEIELALPYNQREFVSPANIVSLKSRGNYVEYAFTERESVKVRRKLDDAFAELSPNLFLRIHKSYAVNMSFIRRIDFSEMLVYLKDGSTAYISRNYKKNVEAAYGEYRRSFGR